MLLQNFKAYTDEENDLIDTLRTNIDAIRDPYKHAIAMTALIRACTKSVPGVFLPTQGTDMMMDERICKSLLQNSFWKLWRL